MSCVLCVACEWTSRVVREASERFCWTTDDMIKIYICCTLAMIMRRIVVQVTQKLGVREEDRTHEFVKGNWLGLRDVGCCLSLVNLHSFMSDFLFHFLHDFAHALINLRNSCFKSSEIVKCTLIFLIFFSHFSLFMLPMMLTMILWLLTFRVPLVNLLLFFIPIHRIWHSDSRTLIIHAHSLNAKRDRAL